MLDERTSSWKRRGFPDARLPDHSHHLADARLRSVQRGIQELELSSRPTNRERPREEAAWKRVRVGSAPVSSKTSTGSGKPFTEVSPIGLKCRNDSVRRVNGLGDQDGPGRGQLLHAGGEMRGLPHRAVVHAKVAADGAHHHLAGIHAHADLHAEAEAAFQIDGERADRLLHPERGIAGAGGMVFMGHRRAEQRHDAVTHDLIDRARVAVDGLHHALEHGIENQARFLGVALGHQLHGALEIGEHHSDLLALTLEGGASANDAIGEMGGRVGLGRCVRRRNGGRRGRAEP